MFDSINSSHILKEGVFVNTLYNDTLKHRPGYSVTTTLFAFVLLNAEFESLQHYDLNLVSFVCAYHWTRSTVDFDFTGSSLLWNSTFVRFSFRTTSLSRGPRVTSCDLCDVCVWSCDFLSSTFEFVQL